MKQPDDIALILMEDLPKLSCGSAVKELHFHATRKWRFDWALPLVKVGIEIDGGAFTQGRHTRGKGFVDDLEKLNYAMADGWRVYRFTPEQVRNGEAMKFLREAVR